MEREALERLCALPRPASTTYPSPSPASTATKPLDRLAVLQRHGRGQNLRVGWDGGPDEEQPMFQNNAFLTTAHYLGIHDLDGVQQSSHIASSTATPRAATEAIALQLLKMGDFNYATLHQLLDAYGEDANKVDLGLVGIGKQAQTSSSTKKLPVLTQYLYHFLRRNGVRDDYTSIRIERAPLCTRDYFSTHKSDSAVHQLCVGNYTGGELWVDSSPGGSFLPKEKTGQRSQLGETIDLHNRVVSFPACLQRKILPYYGDRWTVTAYAHQGYDKSTVQDLSKLALSRSNVRQPPPLTGSTRPSTMHIHYVQAPLAPARTTS